MTVYFLDTYGSSYQNTNTHNGVIQGYYHQMAMVKPVDPFVTSPAFVSNWFTRASHSLPNGIRTPRRPDPAEMASNGISWYGKYLAVRSINNSVQVVSPTVFDNPYDAFELASAHPHGTTPNWIVVDTLKQLDIVLMSVLPDATDEPLRLHTETSKTPFTKYGCTGCGLIGHNSRTCPVASGQRTRHYAKVGIEIEGRWGGIRSVRERAEAAGMGNSGDCSIFGSLHGPWNGVSYTATEFQTKPDTLVGALRQLAEFYPDETDGSCGLHVHVSFKDETHVSQLCHPRFYDYFKHRFETWGRANNLPELGHFFLRLNGHNNYCLPNTNFTDPYNINRYTQLNFTSWGEHRTVECRMLPMFARSDLAYSAITELLNIFEDWLNGEFDAQVTLHSSSAQIEAPAIVQSREVDIDAPYIGPSDRHAAIEIPDLPPLAEGHRRISISQLPAWLSASAA